MYTLIFLRVQRRRLDAATNSGIDTTALLPLAVLLGVVIGVWALLLLVYFPLWVVIGVPGLILVLVLAPVWIVRSRRPTGQRARVRSTAAPASAR